MILHATNTQLQSNKFEANKYEVSKSLFLLSDEASKRWKIIQIRSICIMYLVWYLLAYSCVQLRETREGWPLLTFETEVKWGLKEYKMKGILPWLVHWSCRVGTRNFCPVLTVLVSTKYFFRVIVFYFNSFVLTAQQSGKLVVLGRLSLSMCLWFSL